MKIIVSGGGTGGHIYPAVSIIEEFKRRDPSTEVLYIGTAHGLEADIIPDLGIDFKTIHVKGMPRKLNKKSMIAIRELFKGLRESKKLIKDFDPDVVIGTGGFVSGPVLYSAAKNKKYCVFHEQNSYPGITNRILSNYVDKYFVTYNESIQYFKKQGNAIVTGNPIRNRFEELDKKKDEDYAFFDLDPKKKVVFSFGGSNGSKAINDTILTIKEKINANSAIQWIHVTGKNNYDNFLKTIGSTGDNIKLYPYMNDMDKAYNITDLIITSSGAITLAEISFCGLASILIPKGYTTENHQEFNARVYEKNGAAKVLLEKDLDGNILYNLIEEIISDDKIIVEMKKASKGLAKPNAAKDIVDRIYEEIR